MVCDSMAVTHHILKKAILGLKSIFHQAHPRGSSQIISLQEPEIIEGTAK